MTLKNNLFHAMLCSLIRLSTQSIAGVSYMDHFDFEQRYRNVLECDPFHWYPLHLPPHCAKMYEELIRNGITSLTNTPVRIVKKSESISYKLNPNIIYSSPYFYGFENSQENYEMSPLSPYTKMFQMLRRDVMREPSAPVITNLPGFGAVALYRQPISRKSGQYIKKIAGIYRNVQSEYNEQYQPHTDKAEETSSSTGNPKISKDDNKHMLHQAENEQYDIKEKIKNGNLLAIVKSMHI